MPDLTNVEDPLKQTSKRVERVYIVLVGSAALVTLIVSIGLMFVIGGGPRHLVGRLVIAVAALVVLGWLDTHASFLAKRHRPLLAPDPPGYRRFVVWSSLGMLAATVLLLGLAWYLP